MSEPFSVPHFDKSEVALFGTDVGTDIVNGYNLIEEGHIIWGTIMCILPLAPIGILGPLMFFGEANNKFCAIFLILLLYVPAVSFGTVCYILFVLVAGAWKVWRPDLPREKELFGMEIQYAVMFRIAEIVTESCPQSSLGNRTYCENDLFWKKASTSSCTWDLLRTPGHELFSSLVSRQV